MVRKKSKPRFSIRDLSIQELRELLALKANEAKKNLPKLKKRRSSLASEVARLEDEIATIEAMVGGVAGSARRRGRPKSVVSRKTGASKQPKSRKRSAGQPSGKRGRRGGRDISLRDAIVAILKGSSKPMGPTQIQEAIQRKSLYANPPKSIYQQIVLRLRQSPDFAVVKRGQYKLK